MIANMLNALLGIWLTYVAVLKPAFANEPNWHLPAMAITVIVLAAAARASEYLTWVSTTNILVGVVLLALAALRHVQMAPDLLMFWGVFWAGIFIAVLALWAALYRPRNASGLEPTQR